MKNYHIVEAVTHDDFTITLTFHDGKTGIFNMKPFVNKRAVYKYLTIDMFHNFTIENGRMVWDDNVLIYPEFMYHNLITSNF